MPAQVRRRLTPSIVLTVVLIGLTLSGALVLLGVAIHPVDSALQASLSSMPCFAARGSGVDFYQFWIVGRAIGNQPLDIYDTRPREQMAALGKRISLAQPTSPRLQRCAAARQPIIETFSTPLLYAVVNVVASDDYNRAFDRYLNVCLVSGMLALFGLSRLMGYSVVDGLLFILVCLFWNGAFASDLRVGNVNQLQLAAVAVFLWSRRPRQTRWIQWAGGVVLGLLVAFKPTLGVVPIALATAWAIDRRWRELARLAITASAGAAIGVLAGAAYLASAASWLHWLHAVGQIDQVANITVAKANYSLSQWIYEQTGWSISLLLLAGLLAVVAALFNRTRQRALAGDALDHDLFQRDVFAVAAGCAFSVLALRLAWLHYFILMMPMLMYVLRPGMTDSTAEAAPRNNWLLFGASTVAMLFLFASPLERLMYLSNTAIGLSYVGGGWLLLIIGCVSFLHLRQADTA